MNKKEQELFEKLHNSKLKDSATFSKRGYRGYWNSIVDKYKDSAHFVWELLQNADDTCASKVHFELFDDKLVFSHNGKRHFSITDVELDESSNMPIGDINAIVSIGDSNKIGEEKIGKFGIGFKSVFAYTLSPEIYDDKFKFVIKDYIVPTNVDKDYPDRKKGDTLFVIKFKNPEKAKSDIYQKLSGLENPILFLKHVTSLRWNYGVEEHCFSVKKKLVLEKSIKCERVEVSKDQKREKIYLFSRKVRMEGMKYDVYAGYYLDNGWIDTGRNPGIYCFFPTEESYNTCFISHAPFLTTDNRCNIKEDSRNEQFRKEILKLAIDSLVVIRDIGKESGRPLVDNLIRHYVKLFWHRKNFYWRRDEKVDFLLEYFQKVMSDQKLLYTKSMDYVGIRNGMLLASDDLLNVFSDKQMHMLLGPEYKQKKLLKYSGEVKSFLREELKVEQIEWEDIANKLTEEFMKKQGRKWAEQLYKVIPQNKISAFAQSPIMLTETGEWVSAFDVDGTPLVFFPISSGGSFTGLQLVDRGLVKNYRKFLEELGVTEADYIGYLKANIFPNYTSDAQYALSDDVAISDFDKIVALWSEIPIDKREAYIDEVRTNLKFKCLDGEYRDFKLVYSQTEDLLEYFSLSEGYKPIIDAEFYSQKGHLEFVKELKFEDSLRIIPRDYKSSEDSIMLFNQQCTEEMYKQIEAYDFFLDGYGTALLSKSTSSLIWNSITRYSDCVEAFHMRVNYNIKRGREKNIRTDNESVQSMLFVFLTTSKWIFVDENEGLKPSEVSVEQFAKHYNYSQNKEVATKIGISNAEEERKKADLVKNVPYERLQKLVAQSEEPKEEQLEVDDANPKVKPIIEYLGRMMYQEYLEREGLAGCCTSSEDGGVYDFRLTKTNCVKYIDVDTSTNSFKKGVPLHVTISQNDFLRNNPESEFEIVKVSLRDFDMYQSYEEIKQRFSENFDIDSNEMLRKWCDRVVQDYWLCHDVCDFEDKIHRYQIKIERKM